MTARAQAQLVKVWFINCDTDVRQPTAVAFALGGFQCEDDGIAA